MFGNLHHHGRKCGGRKCGGGMRGAFPLGGVVQEGRGRQHEGGRRFVEGRAFIWDPIATRRETQTSEEAPTGETVTDTAAPVQKAEARQADGVCPLCKNHCPLTAPSCPKGRAYATQNLAEGANGRG